MVQEYLFDVTFTKWNLWCSW